MFNYWTRKAKIPLVGVVLSGYDTKIKGKVLPFHQEVIFFGRRCGWRYSLYMLIIAKLGVQCLTVWNCLRVMAGHSVKLKTFEQICREQGIPLYTAQDFNARETLNFLKNVDANLIISAYNNQIFKSRIIRYPAFKTINIHPGYLPDFRGVDPAFEALYHRVPKAGVSIHYVDTGIDSGAVICQELLRVKKEDTLFSLNVRLWMHGARMLLNVLENIGEHTAAGQKQRQDKVRYPYRSYPKVERINEFIRQGGRLIKIKDLRNTFR